MTSNPSSTTYDDEIDLREIALTLWKRRWLILVLTLTAALISFVVSAWLLPKQYQAVAYVTVSQPTVRLLPGQEGLAAVPTAPDIKALPELVQAETIMEQVASNPRVASLLTSGDNRLAGKTKVAAVGVSQLRFQVTDTDPQRAATLATVWAEKAAEWIEINYGLGALTATLDSQIAQTQQSYAQAQSALETFLAQDLTPVLNRQLTSHGDIYACLERRARAANAFLQRLADLETSLVQSDAPLTLSEAILLVSIEQDIDALETCGSAPVILQPASPMLFNGLSTSIGLEVIASLRQNLQQRITHTQGEQDALQEDMLKLKVEIEHRGYQFNEISRQRNQAQSLYQQLTLQQTVIESVLQQS
ncbi:MAG: Wzz/FepE/Etk N-terminal domain-containing protein, partial [Anaerolineales bacterium]|nr:Wzz/FepE/Etk N-terminal domain-containing protein [Anaerolineales bacterium]